MATVETGVRLLASWEAAEHGESDDPLICYLLEVHDQRIVFRDIDMVLGGARVWLDEDEHCTLTITRHLRTRAELDALPEFESEQ